MFKKNVNTSNTFLFLFASMNLFSQPLATPFDVLDGGRRPYLRIASARVTHPGGGGGSKTPRPLLRRRAATRSAADFSTALAWSSVESKVPAEGGAPEGVGIGGGVMEDID